jgi:alkylation response protein AidB-like acyl-CoA dehydrogenase
MVDFRLDDDQRQIQDMFRKFGEEELGKIARQCDEKAELPEAVLDKVWELGVCANAIPENYGGYGAGRSAVTGAIMAEELAAGDLSLALAALSPALVSVPLLEFGTDKQKEEWLPKFCGEKFHPATAALMEPRVTFDPFDLRTTVDMESDKLILNGQKCMVPLADRASQVLVYATSAKGGGPSAVEAVLVDKGTKGMKVSERKFYQGLRPLPLFNVEFKDCEVPVERRLGGDRGINYKRLLNLSRALLGAMAVGVARSSHLYALEYAKNREAFGEPIASRQAIAFMLAESAMEIDAMRLLAWRAAWRVDKNQDATRDAALAKTYCAEQTMKIVDYGIQILGGHGYIREYPQELYFRNGRSFAALEGLAMV